MSLKPNIFKTPQIYFPKLFTAVSKTVPHIDMTAKEAVAAGYSFRKKRHSVKITKYHGGSHKKHIIPYSIDGMPVDELGKEAFRNCACHIMHIHGNIRKLGEGVFSDSTMYKVIFEDGITSLSKNMFLRCGMLEQVELPLTLKYIGYRCFWFCKSLKYIEFPKSICNIENQAFYACGLEGFGVETLTTGINNADAFSSPLIQENEVVCTYPEPSNLIVLHVGGNWLKFKAESVTFCRWSLNSSNLDLSECKNVRFYRNVIRTKRPRDKENVSYGLSPCTIILPKEQESELHYAFPEHVTVINYFHQKDRSYNKPYEIEYDSAEDTYIITPVADFFPHRTVEEDCEKIRIKGRVHIDRNAINCRNLKEITFEDFRPEDRIFPRYCFELRKVSFKYKGRMYTKYIPPLDLVIGFIRDLMILPFAPCSVPYENGFRHTVYDRQFIDSIFNQKYINAYNNRAMALWLQRESMSGYCFIKRNFTVRMTNKIKALIAVDILRSDRLDHEPPVDMYRDFLRTHRSFCLKYFNGISNEYPEYLQSFEKIMMNS